MSKPIDFWEVIGSRCSIRAYLPDGVEKETIETILKAGIRAPSGRNRQPWRFVVLTRKEDMSYLADEMEKDTRPKLLETGMPEEEIDATLKSRKARMTSAPVAVVLCMDTNDLGPEFDKNRITGEYLAGIQGATLAGGQMLLAAQALGLGSLWIGAPLYAPERVREALDLPDSWVSLGLLLFGYAAESPDPRDRKPLDEVVRWKE